MSQYLTNIGEVNTASITVIASMGAVADVNVINSAGWVVSVANTGSAINVINSADWVVSVANTGSAINIINSADWVVSVANTGSAINIINSAGWLVSVENTASVIVVGTIVMGSSFIISNSSNLQTLVTNTVTAVDIINSAGWVVEVANTGGAYSLINTAGWVVNVGSSVVVANSSQFLVNVENTAGLAVNVINTGGAITTQTPVETIYNLGTNQLSSLTFNISAAGDNSIISGEDSSGLSIYRLMLVTAASNTIVFTNGTGATATTLTGSMSLAANAGMVLDLAGEPWFTTDADQHFVINMVGTGVIAGKVDYTI